MIIRDTLYGEFDLEEVLSEIIQSKPFQRLKNIHQGGASYLVNPEWNVTRYEHSIGVMLLIRRLGGSIEEQIAGLIHDISHTAFSHVIDFVLEQKNQDFHDKIFEKVLFSSDIPQILLKHGFQIQEILPIEKWSLLEQPLPNLCADRIDYTLRDLSSYKIISREKASSFVNELKVVGRNICVQSIEEGEWFVEAYNKEVIDFFLDPLNVYGYVILTDILKTALNKDILHLDDFLLDDFEVWNKLVKSQDEEILHKIENLNKKVISDEINYQFHQKKKVRVIDPLVLLNNNRPIHASEISSKIKELNKKAIERSQKGTYIRVIK